MTKPKPARVIGPDRRIRGWLKRHAGHELVATQPPGGIWCMKCDPPGNYFDSEYVVRPSKPGRGK